MLLQQNYTTFQIEFHFRRGPLGQANQCPSVAAPLLYLNPKQNVKIPLNL